MSPFRSELGVRARGAVARADREHDLTAERAVGLAPTGEARVGGAAGSGERVEVEVMRERMADLELRAAGERALRALIASFVIARASTRSAVPCS